MSAGLRRAGALVTRGLRRLGRAAVGMTAAMDPAALVDGLVRRLGPVRDRFGRYFLVRLLVRTVQELSADDATHMAAGVAYYALFSIFPLLLGLTAIMSYFVDSQETQKELVGFVAQYLPGSGELITHNIDIVLRLRGAIGVFSLIGLLWSASAVFGAIARAVNRAWDVHKDWPIYVGKPRQLLMAAAVAVLFAISVGAAALLRMAGLASETDVAGSGLASETLGRLFLQAVSFVMTLAIFLVVYKFLPNTKTYWRFIWPGAILGALLFEVSKNLFLIYVNGFSNFENVYGSLAPVIALLLWVYVSSFILILGAELSSEYGRLKSGVDRGTLLHA